MEKVTIFILIVAAVVGGEMLLRRRLKRYWNRKCAGSDWKRQFPSASKMQIREFLRLFVEAFCFRSSRSLCFKPDDQIMEVYRTVNPPDWTLDDAMELETFVKDFQRRYGIDLTPLWRDDLTLGELFSMGTGIVPAANAVP